MKTLLLALLAGAQLLGQPSAKDAIIDYSAQDFQTHQPRAADVRNVRLGYVSHDGAKQYVLCGEFAPDPDPEKIGWVPFATIQTDPYEQWLGAQATGACNRPNTVWEETGDLSADLKTRLGLK